MYSTIIIGKFRYIIITLVYFIYDYYYVPKLTYYILLYIMIIL